MVVDKQAGLFYMNGIPTVDPIEFDQIREKEVPSWTPLIFILHTWWLPLTAI